MPKTRFLEGEATENGCADMVREPVSLVMGQP